MLRSEISQVAISSKKSKKLKYNNIPEDLINMWKCNSCGRSFEEDKTPKKVNLGDDKDVK